MKQQSFEQRYSSQWQKLEQMLDSKEAQPAEEFPKLFRELCHQLSIAKHRRYSPQLVDRRRRNVLEIVE